MPVLPVGSLDKTPDRLVMHGFSSQGMGQLGSCTPMVVGSDICVGACGSLLFGCFFPKDIDVLSRELIGSRDLCRNCSDSYVSKKHAQTTPTICLSSLLIENFLGCLVLT